MTPRSEYSDDLPAIERYRIVLGAGLLIMPDFQKIVATIRDRHGLRDPHDQDDLAENLLIKTPQALEPEVLGELKKHRWSKDLKGIGWLAHPERLRPWTRLPILGDLLKIVVQGLEEYHWTDKFFSPLAPFMARHIVIGSMELPQPLPEEYLSTAFAFPVAGDKAVIAFAHAGSDPRQVAEELVRVWHETFPPHDPDQMISSAPTLARSAWIWSTYETLREDRDYRPTARQQTIAASQAEQLGESNQATSLYVTLADMYCEAFPVDSQGEPDTPDRDEYIVKLLPTLRQAHLRFKERWRNELRRWGHVLKDRPPDKSAE
jgi:hypothetical protein